MNIRCCVYVYKKFLFAGIAVISGFACRFPRFSLKNLKNALVFCCV